MRRARLIQLKESGFSFKLTKPIQHIGKGGFSVGPNGPEGYDLHYFSQGEAMAAGDRHATKFSPGDILFRFPGDRTRIKFGRDLVVYHCHFSFGSGCEDVEVDLAAARDALGPWPGIAGEGAILIPDRLHLKKRSPGAELFHNAVTAGHSGHPGELVGAYGYFLLFLRCVSREAIAALLAREEPPGAGASRHVARAIRMIDDALRGPPSPREIAERLKLNPDYLARIFKRQVKCSIGEYARARQMDRAKELLLSTPLSIKEIARSLGFPDPLYFSRLFSRRTRLSPSAFRDRRRH